MPVVTVEKSCQISIIGGFMWEISMNRVEFNCFVICVIRVVKVRMHWGSIWQPIIKDDKLFLISYLLQESVSEI